MKLYTDNFPRDGGTTFLKLLVNFLKHNKNIRRRD